MAKIYTSSDDEQVMEAVMKRGLMASGPKWTILRLALARSLDISSPPDEGLDDRETKGSEYALEQVTGEGLGEGDYTDSVRALLSAYHQEDLFVNQDRFTTLLQRHVRRGLREFKLSWRESHDFHEYLFQELFSDAGLAREELSTSIEDALLSGLKEIGIQGELRGKSDGPRLSRFLVFLPDANDISVLQRGLTKLSFTLGLADQGVFLTATTEPKVVGIDVPRNRASWSYSSIGQLDSWLKNAPPDWRLPIYLGTDVIGNPVGFDLSVAPHLLIGGTTGSGKSVCIHTILACLLKHSSSANLNLCLIDPKRVELSAYRGIPFLYQKDVITDVPSAIEALEELVVEMEARTVRLEVAGKRDLGQVEDSGSAAEPRIVVVVEELADLLIQDPQSEQYLVRLAQKARAVGIHLVLATQRPDAATFSGLLRSNIPSRIALTVQKSSESKIILDDVGAERLLGKGDMLVKITGYDVVRAHGISVTPDDVARVTRDAKGRAML